jgi:hypothetical protein
MRTVYQRDTIELRKEKSSCGQMHISKHLPFISRVCPALPSSISRQLIFGKKGAFFDSLAGLSEICLPLESGLTRAWPYRLFEWATLNHCAANDEILSSDSKRIFDQRLTRAWPI